MTEHQDFIELCALYSTGELPDDQLRRLDEHLQSCIDCRRALDEFHQITTMGLPSLAPDFVAAARDEEVVVDRAQARLLVRIENEILAREQAKAARPASFHPGWGSTRWSWKLHLQARVACVLAAVLAVSLGIYSYHLGARKITKLAEARLRQAQQNADSLRARLSQLSADRDVIKSKLQESNRTIGELRMQLSRQTDEIAALKEQEHQFTAAAAASNARRIAWDTERAALAHQLAAAQAAQEDLRKRIDILREERAADLAQMASLEKRLEQASSAIRERDATIQQQRELLAHDRDIRELIGARDLYVAEVTDVGRNGETQQPFGRVFYTKGKSLIFYAYNLDRQPGVRQASTFQAWGRCGPDFQGALPLGIFYLDSGSNRRWVLKFDDPEAIARIDAVFVTVEPRGGSRKPSGKPLLFAYLKVGPNHP